MAFSPFSLRLYYDGESKRYDGRRKVKDLANFVEDTAFKAAGVRKMEYFLSNEKFCHTDM